MSSPEDEAVKVQGSDPKARLRILETTDLHMQLLAYDYFADHSDSDTGLIQLADRIETLRSDTSCTSVLFDNGDFIQGNPLADYVASNGTDDQPHPMIAAFNTLQYDAITLGNHEFNYGLDMLRAALADARFPVTCANIHQIKGDALALPYVILDRDMPCDDGKTRTLRIGVTGFVTPQITVWDRVALKGELETEDIVFAAERVVPQIKADGADIIIALCHSGIGAADHCETMENAAVPLAALPGIDVVLTGHTHEMFPGDDQPTTNFVDPVNGTLHGKPAVMAGFYGNWLGVIDLQLGWHDGSWTIQTHQSRLEPCSARDNGPSPLQKQLSTHLQTAHSATIRHIRQPIARTEVPIHSYYANIVPDLTQQLLARAQQDFIRRVMAGSQYHALPVLSSTSPFRAGGRAGPSHYIDISPGAIALRDAAAIYPFANTLCGIRRSGAQIRQWLERAASHFAQVIPGQHDQPMINSHSPAYNSDTIFGLSYEFDLSQPAHFAPDGSVINAQAGRVRALKYQGQPVADNDSFIVAANSYRTHGGGGFRGAVEADILYQSTKSARDVLIDYLRSNEVVTQPASHTWYFTHLPDTSAIFQSAPAASKYTAPGVSHVGPGTGGFDQYRFTF